MSDPAPIPWSSTRLALDALVRLEGSDVVLDPSTLPAYTAAVPDLLRLAGISALTVPGAPSCRWIGQGGGEVALNAPGVDARVHRGHLPFAPRAVADLPGDVADDRQARWTDAGVFAKPPGDITDFAVWNPYPWRRRALARTLPGAVFCEEGSESTSVELEAGAVTALDPLAAGSPGARWEISATALDQGRVRAEFDPAGRVSRLCWANVFAHLLAPWPSAVPGAMDRRDLPMDPGGTGPEPAKNTRNPPWTAAVVFERRVGDGVLTLSYGLSVHADGLEILAHWQGSGPLTLRHATQHRGAMLECGDERSQWSVPQAASTLTDPLRIHGLRHASLAGGDGRGLCLAFPQPTTVVAWDGDLRIELVSGQPVRYMMIAAQRPPDAPTRLQTALGFNYNHSPCTRITPASHRSPIRPVLPVGVEALWWRGVPEWEGEILLVEQSLSRARSYLFAPAGRRPGRAVRVDAWGKVLNELDPTPEGDGWVVDLDPGVIALVRWRLG